MAESRRYGLESLDDQLGGSLFLFDRKVQRYFRKDGHNWKKKKDGKIEKEAHVRLKVGGTEALQCYYAHGEENKNFQRRSYWMIEQDPSHIVLVHYQEIKGNRKNLNHTRETEETEDILPNSECHSSAYRSFHPKNINKEENFHMQDNLQVQLSNQELGDVNETHMQSSSRAYWDSVEGESRVDESSISDNNYTLGPSLYQDQRFSIIDFSINWGYEVYDIMPFWGCYYCHMGVQIGSL